MRYIAIVGSVSPTRTDYHDPVRDHTAAVTTAEVLGAELAEQGFGLIVYSAHANFIEADLVRSYVATGKAKKKSIRWVYPAGDRPPEFAEYKSHDDLFDPDGRKGEWELAYYRSLKDAGGILLMGGGYSTLITGLLAMNYSIPMIAFRHFGGSAEKIWNYLEAGQSLMTQDSINLMGRLPRGDDIRRLILSFKEQATESHRRTRRGVWRALVAGLPLLLWVMSLPLGYQLIGDAGSTTPGSKTLFLFLLFLVPLVAGASGATIRYALPSDEHPPPLATVLGAAAGAATGVLYIASQYVGGAPLHNFAWLLFAAIFGFVGGFTFDQVFAKLRTVDAVRSDVFTR